MKTCFAAAVLLSLVSFSGRIVTAQTDFDAFLDECESEGTTAGTIASRGACAVLLNKCPPPPPERTRAPPGEASARIVVPEPIQAVLEKTCDSLFVESCKKSGTEALFAENFREKDCRRILQLGPGPGAKDCPNLSAAADIFGDSLEELCEATPTPSPSGPVPTPGPVSPPPAKDTLLSGGKPTSQSSTILGATSDRAVDGNKDTKFSSGSCTHTGTGDRLPKSLFPWWSVDLGTAQKITRVEITNRSDCCGDRLSNFEIFVGDANPSDPLRFINSASCGSGLSVPSGETKSFDCSATGRHVTIRIPGFSILTLCEVEVFGE